MAEELKGLLEKIRREGIDAAEEAGRLIEAESRKRAGSIVEDARKEAALIVSEANSRIAKTEESLRQSLAQASRDTLISLRKEIGATLDRIVASHIHRSLGPEELIKIILALVADAGCTGKDRTIVSLKREDLEKIEKALLGELGAEARKGIVLKHGADIKGGFTISYDGGKSYYDFTDRALAEYLSAALKPELGRILLGASDAAK